MKTKKMHGLRDQSQSINGVGRGAAGARGRDGAGTTEPGQECVSSLEIQTAFHNIQFQRYERDICSQNLKYKFSENALIPIVKHLFIYCDDPRGCCTLFCPAGVFG